MKGLGLATDWNLSQGSCWVMAAVRFRPKLASKNSPATSVLTSHLPMRAAAIALPPAQLLA